MAKKRAGLILVLLALGGSAGCAGMQTYEQAVWAWRQSDARGAVGAARAEYRRFRDGNDLEEAAVRAATDAAVATLDEQVVLPEDEVPTDLRAGSAWQLGPDAMRAQIRRDLLSGQATKILRATASVQALGLKREAEGLFAVIFRREPIEADSPVLREASMALRSLAVKRAALDALEAL